MPWIFLSDDFGDLFDFDMLLVREFEFSPRYCGGPDATLFEFRSALTCSLLWLRLRFLLPDWRDLLDILSLRPTTFWLPLMFFVFLGLRTGLYLSRTYKSEVRVFIQI